MCGEHDVVNMSDSTDKGSSPHVRGALPLQSNPAKDGGIIPTCAGSTFSYRDTLTVLGDHPRMCGEHPSDDGVNSKIAGSSPHVRGAHELASQPRARRGIIPACAGSTSTAAPCLRSARDHPRMCGEHPLLAQMAVPRAGSSPHVRGARSCCFGVTTGVGIIPACAGSTPSKALIKPRPRDHPRMCGEHVEADGVGADGEGSSPHVRGAPNIRPLAGKGDGIIPACAGSTACQVALERRRWDHPRMCGEHHALRQSIIWQPGSSPHVRGALRPKPSTVPGFGIIPACAGSTYYSHCKSPILGDHPRMCGEHLILI